MLRDPAGKTVIPFISSGLSVTDVQGKSSFWLDRSGCFVLRQQFRSFLRSQSVHFLFSIIFRNVKSIDVARSACRISPIVLEFSGSKLSWLTISDLDQESSFISKPMIRLEAIQISGKFIFSLIHFELGLGSPEWHFLFRCVFRIHFFFDHGHNQGFMALIVVFGLNGFKLLSAEKVRTVISEARERHTPSFNSSVRFLHRRVCLFIDAVFITAI